MRAVTVYRLSHSSDTIYSTRHPIGAVLELRRNERVGNYNDLLRLARRLFASDTADAVDIIIDVNRYHPSHPKEEYHEIQYEGSGGSHVS